MVNVKVFLLPELISMLTESTISVAIKGKPGFAKTVFSLNIMESILEKGGIAYFFTPAVKKKRFLLKYSWLQEKNLDKYILDFSDLRLEIPITLGLPAKDFASLNCLFNYFYDKKQKPAVLILDSVNFKSKLGLSQDDISLEEYLLHLAYDYNVSLILCYESIGESLVDTLVDTIITLKKYYIEGRVCRTLTIEKVTETKLMKTVYLFSVLDSKIYHFRESSILISSLNLVRENIDYSSKKIPTLIPSLDNLLGGYTIGSLNLLYSGPNVGRDYRWFIVPTFANLILNRYPIFMIPSVATPYDDTKKWFVPCVSEELFRKYLFVFETTLEETYEENVIKLQGVSLAKDMQTIIEMIDKITKSSQAALFGFFIGTDTLEYTYGITEFKKHFGTFVRELVNRNGIIFLVNKPGQETTDAQLNYAHTHFKLMNYLGTILFYGERPFTPLYVVTFDETKKQVDLVPIE